MTLHEQRRAERMGDPEFAAEYARSRAAMHEAWLRRLPELSDLELIQVSMSAIHESAFWASRKGDHDHEHERASACYRESERRKLLDGHAASCRPRTRYSVAHARVMRESGFMPSPLGSCSCGIGETSNWT